jgi:hypothetical protein
MLHLHCQQHPINFNIAGLEFNLTPSCPTMNNNLCIIGWAEQSALVECSLAHFVGIRHILQANKPLTILAMEKKFAQDAEWYQQYSCRDH